MKALLLLVPALLGVPHRSPKQDCGWTVYVAKLENEVIEQ